MKSPLAVLAALVGALGLLVPGVAFSGATPAHAAPVQDTTAEHVILIGAAGLRWEDINPALTPTLWALAEDSALASMSVRSAQRHTCPADGWLTLGAGNQARVGDAGGADDCEAALPTVELQEGGSALMRGARQIYDDNRTLYYRARPGVLAEMVRCTVAVGHGAGIAAASPGVGRISVYREELPDNAAELFESCALSIVDLGTIPSLGRQAALRTLDSNLATILDARPERTLVMVVGVADTAGAARLHVALANGAGFERGWLESATTRRAGYIQLIDIAPTAAEVLGLPRSDWFAGAPLTVQPRSADLAAATSTLVDADQAAWQQFWRSDRFLLILVVAQLVLFVVAIPVLRRARQASTKETRWVPVAIRVVELAAVAAALWLPAALLAELVPWWSQPHPGLIFATTGVAVLLVLTALVRLAPWWRTSLGPLGTVAGIAAVVVAADLLTGAHLQLNGMVGYNAVNGGRLAGASPIGAGVFAVGILIAAGCLAQWVPRSRRPLVIAVLGGLGVVVVGLPALGADSGSAIALTAGTCVAAVICTGGWLTMTRLLWGTLAGLVVTSALALLNLRQPETERGRLGRFLTDLGDGTAGAVLHRTGEANVLAFATSPLTWLFIGAGLFVAFVLLRPSGGLKRVYGLYPAVRAAVIGAVIAATLGGLADGAVSVAGGAAAATLMPMLLVSSLRVLVRADQRTAPPEGFPATRPADEPRYAMAQTKPTAAQPATRRVSKDGRKAEQPATSGQSSEDGAAAATSTSTTLILSEAGHSKPGDSGSSGFQPATPAGSGSSESGASESEQPRPSEPGPSEPGPIAPIPAKSVPDVSVSESESRSGSGSRNASELAPAGAATESGGSGSESGSSYSSSSDSYRGTDSGSYSSSSGSSYSSSSD